MRLGSQNGSVNQKWRSVLRCYWIPRLERLNIVKKTLWQAFLWSASTWKTLKVQRDKNCELECEGCCECDWFEETPLDADGPTVETVAPNRTPLDFEG